MKGLILFRIIFILSYIFLSVIPTAASEETNFQARDEETQKRVATTKLKIKLINSELSNSSFNLKLFSRLSDPIQSEKEGYLVPSTKVVPVSDPNSWPDNTVDSYLVLLNRTGSVIAFEVSPISESGDWSNTYTHYFDEKGNTIAFKRYSGFFMGCPAGVSKETSIYYYDQKHQLIQKEYTLVDGDGKTINPKECEFMYRHDYKIYKSWNDLANDIGIFKALNAARKTGG